LAEVLQDANQETADRVPSQIARNEAQTEPIPMITGLLLLRDRTAEGCRVLAIVFGMGFG
jgi:hypothetical protein